ncbi:MAG: VPGUxxT family thioredoxin-like (seleno)protein, type 2 [Planctomycetota bacterium]
MKRWALALAAIGLLSPCWAWGQTDAVGNAAAGKTEAPIEVGKVHWNRDFEHATQLSRESGKPMFVLFQEVPGCAGCQQFGREVLSEPLLVEAIEGEFVPVVIYNNRDSGSDARLLARFQEPSWNYQVVRFLDDKGEDIIPRKDKVWTLDGIAARMVQALEQAQRTVPKYIVAMAAGSGDANRYGEAAFAQHCFWTGEYELGHIDGVIATEAGWLDGREVTVVQFDKHQLSLEALIQQASQSKCADKVYTRAGGADGSSDVGVLDDSYRRAETKDQKRQLMNWPDIPGLTKMQATKLNALAPRDRQAALEWLSPQQRRALKAASNGTPTANR